MFVFDELTMGKSRIVRGGLVWIANSIRLPNYGKPCFWFLASIRSPIYFSVLLCNVFSSTLTRKKESTYNLYTEKR